MNTKLTEDRVNHVDGESLLKFALTDEEWKQILDNQEIVDELIKCYRECRSRQENLAISQFETDQQLFMEKLYKRATGKNIKELS